MVVSYCFKKMNGQSGHCLDETGHLWVRCDVYGAGDTDIYGVRSGRLWVRQDIYGRDRGIYGITLAVVIPNGKHSINQLINAVSLVLIGSALLIENICGVDVCVGASNVLSASVFGPTPKMSCMRFPVMSPQGCPAYDVWYCTHGCPAWGV